MYMSVYIYMYRYIYIDLHIGLPSLRRVIIVYSDLKPAHSLNTPLPVHRAVCLKAYTLNMNALNIFPWQRSI